MAAAVARQTQPLHQRAKFDFPNLKTREIIDCLFPVIDGGITEDDIAKPTANRMQHIYDQLLLRCVGISRQMYINYAQSDAWAETVEHPDIFRDGAGHLGFFRQVRNLMNTVGIFDFNMRDMSKPETTRVKRILSAVINFMRFQEDRFQVFDQCLQQSVRVFVY